MDVSIKSITPKLVEGHNHYEFQVELEIDGKPERLLTLDATKILDPRQFRAFVAQHTGCLLADTKGKWASDEREWTALLAKKWQAPEPKPDRPGDLAEIE